MVSAPTASLIDLVFQRWWCDKGECSCARWWSLQDESEQNFRDYRSAQFLNTDHRLVVATLKLQLKFVSLPTCSLGWEGSIVTNLS